jgi:hypothetical protein
MAGGLSELLPEPIGEESEEILLALIERKVKGAAGLAVDLLHAMEERFGPEAREVVRELAQNRLPTPRADPGEPEADLRRFCDRLDRGCAGSHRWERVIDQPGRIGYQYIRCLWAQVFRELGEPELGYVICAGDEPAVRAFNPKLGFRRTQVLMLGDSVCDHVFYVESSDEMDDAGPGRP